MMTIKAALLKTSYPQVVVEEVDLLLHLIHLLCVLGHNVLPHKVWPLELLARQRAQPLVLKIQNVKVTVR